MDKLEWVEIGYSKNIWLYHLYKLLFPDHIRASSWYRDTLTCTRGKQLHIFRCTLFPNRDLWEIMSCHMTHVKYIIFLIWQTYGQTPKFLLNSSALVSRRLRTSIKIIINNRIRAKILHKIIVLETPGIILMINMTLKTIWLWLFVLFYLFPCFRFGKT